MINSPASVAEATKVELIDGTGDDPYLIVSVRIHDQEPTQIRIGHEHIRHLADVLPRHQNSHRNKASAPAPAGYVVIGAKTIDLNVDPMGEQAALVLDHGNGLKCLLPLTIDLADQLAEVGREASGLLRCFAGPRIIN